MASNAIGVGWAAPTILLGGTENPKARYLDRIFTHEDIWCQLFSEPDAVRISPTSPPGLCVTATST